MVRRAVATVESVFRMPHLARTAVRPAKRAEPKAKRIHITHPLLFHAMTGGARLFRRYCSTFGGKRKRARKKERSGATDAGKTVL